MQIDFHSSAGPTLGIEVELELVDVRTGELVSAASEILAEIGQGHLDGIHPKAKHELLECCIEVITGVCTTVSEAQADLAATIAEVREAAAKRNLTLICSGSHPFSQWSEQQITDDDRYHQLIDEVQWMGRRLQIFGVHVHVGVRSPDKAVVIANAVADHIPHFLALSASSPFWEGHDTGLASSRSKVFEGLPTAGLPPWLESWADFEVYMSTLIAAGAISTVREVWWDVRPHPDFGTIELRMCDGIPSLGEVASIAALAQCLVAHLDALDDAGEAPVRQAGWLLAHNKWRAGRHGLEASFIVDEGGALQPARDAIADLVQLVRPQAEQLGCVAELDGIAGILEIGPSYVRQRAASGGGKNLLAVVDHLARELAADERSR
ncbi:glutamate--cysteine ligase [Aquihabitans daechungensis]|uniref:glutamate--cysteine ligase n=1 Tax=Aquihabitans daechungensis TaxID=1052257 RepID=UPI003B9E3F3D